MKARTCRALAAMTLAMALLAGCQSWGDGGGAVRTAAPAQHATASGEATASTAPMFPAHFQATVYEVKASSERLGMLDGKALTAQATQAGELLKALTAVGTARILYRIDQPVNVFSERITVGSSEPVVTATRRDVNGNAINSVTYRNVGVVIRMTAQPPPREAKRKEPDVTMNVELVVLGRGDTEIAPGLRATVTRTTSLEHRAPLKFNRPAVMLSSTTTSTDHQGPGAAYVVRYCFSQPVGR